MHHDYCVNFRVNNLELLSLLGYIVPLPFPSLHKLFIRCRMANGSEAFEILYYVIS